MGKAGKTTRATQKRLLVDARRNPQQEPVNQYRVAGPPGGSRRLALMVACQPATAGNVVFPSGEWSNVDAVPHDLISTTSIKRACTSDIVLHLLVRIYTDIAFIRISVRTRANLAKRV